MINIGTLIKYTHDSVIPSTCLGIVVDISHGMGNYGDNLYYIWWSDDGEYTEEEERDSIQGFQWEVLCE